MKGKDYFLCSLHNLSDYGSLYLRHSPNSNPNTFGSQCVHQSASLYLYCTVCQRCGDYVVTGQLAPAFSSDQCVSSWFWLPIPDSFTTSQTCLVTCCDLVCFIECFSECVCVCLCCCFVLFFFSFFSQCTVEYGVSNPEHKCLIFNLIICNSTLISKE